MRRTMALAALLGAGLWLGLAWTSLARDAKKDAGDNKKLDDATFVKKAAIIGMAEVQMGNLALRKGTTQGLKDYGRMLVMDHTRANQQLLAIAMKKNFTVPRMVDQKHRDMAEKLATMDAQKFDKAFLHHMIEGHHKAIKLFKEEARDGQDQSLKSFATVALPVLEKHLKMAERLAGKERNTKTGSGTGR